MEANDIDTDISNYTLSELMAIVDIQGIDPKEITTKTNKLINKFKNSDPTLSVFFMEVQSQLLQYSQGLIYNTKDENQLDKVVVESFSNMTSKAAIYPEGEKQVTDRFQNEYLKDDLCYLDMLAKEYIDKRKQGSIGEDVELGKLSSYNDENVKNSLIKLLVYFTFKGTGSKTSEHECNSVLIINKNGSLSFILCNTEKEKETYIQTIIEKSIISFRNKGMPKIQKAHTFLKINFTLYSSSPYVMANFIV